MDISPSLLEGLLMAAIGGLVGWMWKMQGEIQATKLDLAKNYHGKDELRKVVEDAVGPLMKAIVRLERMVEKNYFNEGGE